MEITNARGDKTGGVVLVYRREEKLVCIKMSRDAYRARSIQKQLLNEGKHPFEQLQQAFDRDKQIDIMIDVTASSAESLRRRNGLVRFYKKAKWTIFDDTGTEKGVQNGDRAKLSLS